MSRCSGAIEFDGRPAFAERNLSQLDQVSPHLIPRHRRAYRTIQTSLVSLQRLRAQTRREPRKPGVDLTRGQIRSLRAPSFGMMCPLHEISYFDIVDSDCRPKPYASQSSTV